MKKTILLVGCLLFLQGCSTAPLQNELKEKEATIAELNANVTTLKQAMDRYLPIYGLDKTAQAEEVHFYVHLPEDSSLKDQLNVVASTLSRFKFSNLPIEVMRIEDRNGKKIALIDLREDSNHQSSWETGYFQGSTGGGATTLTLAKSFLQPNYKGDWIDGVEFYYKGKPMSEWDHVNLQGIIERKPE